MRYTAVYRIRATAADIAARAATLAVEQSVEMPVEAVADAAVREAVVGRVDDLRPLQDGQFEARIGFAVEAAAGDAGQLMNMLFGNSSLHADVELVDVDLPAGMAAAFGGPGHGIAGLRALAGAPNRALTCSALKPLGSSAEALADLAGRLALGGLDFLKDDHGLADQRSAPFAQRVAACADAVRRANAASGGRTTYLPSVTGDGATMRERVRIARDAGVRAVLVAPMVSGVANLQALRRACPDMLLVAHPALGGAARIAPPLLFGRLFRLFGADATVFPNHGGRFGWSPQTCLALAEAARAPWAGLAPCMPVAAGGMTVARVPEMLDFYGPEVMLLIGGGLLSAGTALVEQTRAFTSAVASHVH